MIASQARNAASAASTGREQRGRALAILFATAIVIAATSSATAQSPIQREPLPPPQQSLAPSAPALPPGAPQQPSAAPPLFGESRPGVLDAIGRFFEQGGSNIREHLDRANDKASETGKDALDATKSAVDAVAKLPTARVIRGREVCPVAGNGAPDCQAAATKLCQAQGFATGQSMDFTSAEKCPPKVWVSGRRGPEDVCTTETFISRAMCQ